MVGWNISVLQIFFLSILMVLGLGDDFGGTVEWIAASELDIGKRGDEKGELPREYGVPFLGMDIRSCTFRIW